MALLCLVYTEKVGKKNYIANKAAHEKQNGIAVVAVIIYFLFLSAGPATAAAAPGTVN